MSGPGGPTPPRGGGRVFWFVLVAILLGGATLLLWSRFPDALSTDADKAYAFQYVAIAALIASGMLLGRRIGVGSALRSILAWGALAVLLVLGYTYRDDLSDVVGRVTGELRPSQGTLSGERALTFRQSRGGHFLVEARVGEVPVRFLVDTGASAVILSRADAARLGFDPAKLRYTQRFGTANGEILAAPVTLPSVAIGPARFDDVRAYVSDGNFAGSLLGMSLLGRFRSYEVKDGTLTLRW
ncbi:MAG TPA: TIGR02281 family clan AA aspartic protease [Alphaproteobacteria bacterium]|jgi:aspartyl protease family protein|nr:TIGR02281 family clan AA aspartic protease [Alphaproteobacteria bacterium]